MKVYGEEKPSPEDVEHFGVKGMQWGQRKKYSASDIKGARLRQRARDADVERKAEALNLATGPGSGKSEASQRKAAKAYVDSVNKFNKNPDATMALRMTRGEKTAAVLIGGPLGLVVLGANAAAVKKSKQINNEK